MRTGLAALLSIACGIGGGVCVARAQETATDVYLAIPVGGGPVDVGPVPAGIDAVDAASCGACHRPQYREWRRSAHRTSYTNALFQQELGRRQRPFCVRCHAPRPDVSAGIDCAVCHVRDGAVLNPTVTGRAPHASRVAPEIAGTLACARCHQFEFEAQGHETAADAPQTELLQRTVDEWMMSAHDDTPCQGCHMPARGRRSAHDFPGGLDASMLRDAVRVEARAERDGEITRLTLEVSADRAGHAVPTGDIFRRLVVRAWPLGDREREASVTLARRFRIDRGVWRERDDERVPARGTRTVALEIAGAATRVGYAIDLWRTLPQRARRHGWSPADVRRRLASGAVRVQR